MRPTKQIYANYTEEDFAVWKLLYNRQMEILEPLASEAYLKAVNKVNFKANEIPDFKKTDSILAPLTGWGIEVVPNLCPQKEFFEFLSKKKFTATCWLRTMAQLDYLEEPDMFHDVFAHIPLLTDKAYGDFFLGMSKIALDFIDNPNAIELLSRLYLFTIEFGLIHEKGQLKIYGAGIISSKGETHHSVDPKIKKYDFNVEQIMNTPYRTDIMQDKYFVVDSFEQLYKSLPKVRSCLESKLQTVA